MGRKDIITKDYMADNDVFADVFNHMIYKGKNVIDPGNLKELDATTFMVPYGTDKAGVPYQKYRDVFKVLSAMEDERAVYLLLGAENQDKLHYAMPVKNLAYDAMGYAGQVQQAARTHRKAAKEKSGEEKKPDTAEFLSGFYKEDHLVPIITVVIYFGTEHWDAPRSLHEMFLMEDETVLSLVPDYRINLIAPGEMTEEELDHFTTNFGEVMRFIKYSEDKEKLKQYVETHEGFKNMDVKAARVIKEVTGMEIEIKQEDEQVNVCKAIRGIKEEGIEEGIKKGSENEQKLMKCLLNDARFEDMKRALDDSDFHSRLLKEYKIN